MKKEPIFDTLKRRLGEFSGQHNRIARESGVPQSTVSRIYLGQCTPRLDSAQALLNWFDAQDAAAQRAKAKRRAAKSAPRFSNAKEVRVPGRARSAAAALGQ